MTISQTEAQRLFRYNPYSGVVTRRIDVGTKVKAGDVAGYFRPDGYCVVAIEGRKYLVHRIIWLYVYGSFPKHDIDHIDGVPSNNRIRNLRSVTHRENLRNRKMPRNNKTGTVGVTWNNDCEKWQVRINTGVKQIHIGLFNIKEDAIAARKAAEIEHGYHPNHGRA